MQTRVRALAVMLTAAAAAGAEMEVTLNAEDGTEIQTLVAQPASTGLPLGVGEIIDLPSLLEGEGTLYWATEAFSPGAHFELTCPPWEGHGSGKQNGKESGDGNEDGCHTGWAKGSQSTCLNTIEGISRWGWTNLVTGDEVMPIYAGAGQCDVSKGALVGYATVTYTADGVRVQVEAVTGFTMAKYHIYVGSDMLPTKPDGSYTAAPGQFPESGNDVTFPDVDMTGPLYVAVHVSACGNVKSCDCTFYVVTYYCPPCSDPISGGFQALRVEDGWTSSRCSPKFTYDGQMQPTIAYKVYVPSGNTYSTIPSTEESLFVGVFGVPCDGELPCEVNPHHKPGGGPNGCLAYCIQ